MAARGGAADALGVCHVGAADLRGEVAQALAKRQPDAPPEELAQVAAKLVGEGDYTMADGVDVAAFADSVALYQAFTTCDDAYLRDKLAESLQVLTDAYRVFGPQGVFTSFNGGKDAVVIMQLSRAALAKTGLAARRIDRARIIFFEIEGEFPDVKAFVDDAETTLDLDLRRYGTGFVAGLTECIAEEQNRPMGFVLGTRRGDPNCGKQGVFEPSSDWMPAFMRVNPVIEWHYGHIWHFLRLFNLPYCCLYDEGYTSLGKVSDTFPNPALKKSGAAKEYWPAYMLSDWTLERAGRSLTSQEASSLACQVTDMTSRRNGCANPASASLLIIGDEILKGKCGDSNTPYATRTLRSKGVPLQRVATVQDDLDDICEELKFQMQRYDLVITSGGLGPTHDDVTIKAVAAALGQRLRANRKMETHLRQVKGMGPEEVLPEEFQKMAMLPELSRLNFVPENSEGKEDGVRWPILQCENVFILPGVPQFFEAKLDDILEFFVEGSPIYTYKIVLGIEEPRVVSSLDDAVAAHANVTFGSYPFVGHETAKTVLTLEGGAADEVDEALGFLMNRLPVNSILRVEEDDTL